MRVRATSTMKFFSTDPHQVVEEFRRSPLAAAAAVAAAAASRNSIPPLHWKITCGLGSTPPNYIIECFDHASCRLDGKKMEVVKKCDA